MVHGNRSFIQLAAYTAIMSLGISCTSSTKRVESTTASTSSPGITSNSVSTGSSVGAARMAQEADASYFVEIRFPQGSDKLDEQAKAQISTLLAQARANGTVDEVKVLSWADEEYPSDQRRKLSHGQRGLADNRSEHIEDYIDSFNYDVDVDTYNMAERPSVVSRWLNTSDARFKKSLVAAGLPTTADSPELNRKASHAVVLVLMD